MQELSGESALLGTQNPMSVSVQWQSTLARMLSCRHRAAPTICTPLIISKRALCLHEQDLRGL